MLIEEVRIENLFSHKDSRIKFYNGINLILGDNGSGKTSILNAIAFALFKTKPHGLKLKDMIRIGSKEAKVLLRFRVGDKVYEIVRKILDGTSSVLYEINGEDRKIISRNDKEIEKRLIEILEINEDIFLNSIYIKQGEIASIIYKPPSERKKILAKILGIENIEKAYKELKYIIDKYENKKNFLKEYQKEYGKLVLENHERKKRLNDLLEKHSKLKKRYEEILSKKERIEIELKELEEKMNLIIQLKELKTKLEGLNKEITFLKDKKEFVEKNKALYERYVTLSKEYEKLSHEVSTLKERIRSLNEIRQEVIRKTSEYRKIEKEIKTTLDILDKYFETRNLDELKSIRNRIGDEIMKCREAKEHLIKEQSSLEAMLKREEKFLNELKRVKDRCPVCNSKLDEATKKKIIEEKISTINTLREKLSALKEEITVIEFKLKELDSKRNILEKYNVDYIKLLIDRKETLKKEIDNLIKTINENIYEILKEKENEKRNIEDELKKLQPIYNRYISCMEILKERSLQSLINERNEVETKMKSLTTIVGDEKEFETKYKKLRNKYEEIENERHEIGEKISKIEGIIENERDSILKLEEKLKELKEKIEEKKALERFIRFLHRIRKVFDKNNLQRRIREQYIPLIEDYTKYFYKKFNIPFNDIKIDEDLNIVIFKDQGKQTMDSLSGGEKIALALSLRLAISRLFASKMELIILDEPTIHLDTNRKECLINILRDLKDIPQAIIVTHDKEFEQIGENIIDVSKEGDISKVTQRVPSFAF